jgi:hypothetical protein
MNSDPVCPNCHQGTLSWGYGYAFGGGLGGYKYCKKECGYYQKWPDPEIKEDDKDD